jgi:hypothetical protein
MLWITEEPVETPAHGEVGDASTGGDTTATAVTVTATTTVHAILHDEQGASRCTALGRHAFATDGGADPAKWHYGDKVRSC